MLCRRIGTSATFVSLPCRTRLTGYRAEELVGNMKQTDSSFVLSPTPMTAAGSAWPSAAGGGTSPAIGDLIISQGRQRKIEAVSPVVVGGEIVRFDGRILG